MKPSLLADRPENSLRRHVVAFVGLPDLPPSGVLGEPVEMRTVRTLPEEPYAAAVRR
jgi:hypothetical protein